MIQRIGCLQLAKLLLRPLNIALTFLGPCMDRDRQLEFPPIFIVGAPRSGSTLLYQIMIASFGVGYLSNLHCLLYGAVSRVERVFPTPKGYELLFESRHGKTSGWHAPSECGDFWYRFFRRCPQYVSLAESDPKQLQQLRRAVAAFTSACNKPVLFKNLMNTVRLQPLASALPEALFIVIERNLVANAHSLLAGRKAAYGTYDRWWSLEPPGVDKLKSLPVHQQAVEQVLQTYALIRRDAEVIGSARFFHITYEELCSDTLHVVEKLSEFFKKHQVELQPNTAIPKTFQISSTVRIEDDLYSQLVEYAAKRLKTTGN